VRRGRHALTEQSTPRALSAYDLLAGTPVDRHDVTVPPALLADLHAPDLVITPHYVGPRRQNLSRLHPAVAPLRSGPRAAGPGRWLRGYQALVVALASVAVAVPLTLLVAHQPAQAHPAAPTRMAQPQTARVRPEAPVAAGGRAAAHLPVHPSALQTSGLEAPAPPGNQGTVHRQAGVGRRSDRAARRSVGADRPRSRGVIVRRAPNVRTGA